MNPFFQQVYSVVGTIPHGKVASYGQIARALGRPRAAREVGWAMRCCPDGLPWQRVVTLRKCEKIDAAKMGKSQQTLLERRIADLKVALTLIEKEQTQVDTGSETTMKNERIYKMTLASVYPMYVQKAQKKGRTKDEVDTVICWLTGYDEPSLQSQIEKEVTFETFFAKAPRINPNADKITGVICGVRVEEIEDPLMRKIRWLDKLVDELAKGKAMEKVLRS